MGCGSIGRRHIRLLKEMDVDVVGYDTSAIACEKARRDLAVTVFDNLDGAWNADPDGVIIATPPNAHAQSAREVIAQWQQRGRYSPMAFLIEKPLAHCMKDAKDILYTSIGSFLTATQVLTGYNFRFHQGVRCLKQLLDAGAIGKPLHASIRCGSYLPDWRPDTDYRAGYAASKAMGGGVLLDISHEFDLANWLFGKPHAVMCMKQHTETLEIETEDSADIIICYDGVQVSVHLDYLDQLGSRGIRVVGLNGILDWDYYTDKVVRRGKRKEHLEWVGGGHPSPDDMYRAELQHFLAVIRGDQKPLCTGEDGLLALKVALAAHESADMERVTKL